MPLRNGILISRVDHLKQHSEICQAGTMRRFKQLLRIKKYASHTIYDFFFLFRFLFAVRSEAGKWKDLH